MLETLNTEESSLSEKELASLRELVRLAENSSVEKAIASLRETGRLYEILLPLAAFLKIHQKAQALEDLRKDVQTNRSAKQYLDLGRNGVPVLDLSCRFDNLELDDLVDLWDRFYSFLLRMKRHLSAINKLSSLLAKISQPLLLCFALLEFPNRHRPPCTTMPWTIWPALVVLWGVCWMFYEGNYSDWTSSDGFPVGGNTNYRFEDIGIIDSFQGDFRPLFLFDPVLNLFLATDFNPGGIDFEIPMWNEAVLEPLNLEMQLELDDLQYAIDYSGEITVAPLPALSSTIPQETVILPVASHGEGTESANAPVSMSSTAISTTKSGPEREATGPMSIPPQGPPAGTRQGQDQPKKSARISKHSQTERYFCTHENCNRSRPGSGFNRKDHLDQHLRGVHKQNLVLRLRGESAGTVTGVQEPTTAPQTAERSKKRKRDNEEDLGHDDSDDLSNELARERRLRQMAEQENQQLRRKIENYEERMQKYEDRLDRMMSLLEQERGKDKS